MSRRVKIRKRVMSGYRRAIAHITSDIGAASNPAATLRYMHRHPKRFAGAIRAAREAERQHVREIREAERTLAEAPHYVVTPGTRGTRQPKRTRAQRVAHRAKWGAA